MNRSEVISKFVKGEVILKYSNVELSMLQLCIKLFISLFSAHSDQISISNVVDMVTPTSTLLHTTNIDHGAQMNPGDRVVAGINNTLHPQFEPVIDFNSSSWGHIHHLGTY